MTVDSTPGQGTTFTVYLPQANARPPASVAARALVRQGAGQVLLVDDEQAVLRATTRMIEKLGYKVTAFSRSEEALQAVGRDPNRFDVVITDQNMPDLGGLELARAVGALSPQLPIALVSGNLSHSAEELSAANVRYRLAKPYTLASLSEVLSRAVEAPPAPP